MKGNKAPQSIPFTDPIFDFCFHPTRQLVIAGLITGYIYCYQYGTETNTLQWSTQTSKKSCRGVEFNHDGSLLMTISRDKSIQTLDTNTGKLMMKIPKAHRYPINKIHALDLSRIATGDDEGVIKIWDLRTPTMAQQYTVHDDFIADLTFAEGRSTLLAAGGDGVLSIHDTRKLDRKVATCTLDDELLALTTIKNDEQVVAGSQSGALYFWQWNEWTSIKDKWLGHPSSVDTLCKLDEDTLCTGGNDGLLRLVSVTPDYQFEGVLGDHGEDFPVERVRLSSQNANGVLASCGHDMNLRFWDIGDLYDSDADNNSNSNDDDDNDDDQDDQDDGNISNNKKRQDDSSPGHTKRVKQQHHQQDFFLEL